MKRRLGSALLSSVLVTSCLPPVHIRGQLVEEHRSGLPIAGAGLSFGGMGVSARSDSSGRFDIAVWPWEGCVRLAIRHLGHSSRIIYLRARRSWRYDFGRIPMHNNTSEQAEVISAGGCRLPQRLPRTQILAVVLGRAVDTAGTPLSWHLIEGDCRNLDTRGPSWDPSPYRYYVLTGTDNDGAFALEFVFPQEARGTLDTLSHPPCTIRDAAAYAPAGNPYTIIRAQPIAIGGLRIGAPYALGNVTLPQP